MRFGHRRRPRLQFVFAVCLAFTATVGCSRTETTPPGPGDATGPSRPAVEIQRGGSQADELAVQRMDSPVLVHEPAPERMATPILRQLINSGWDVNANLNAEVRPIRSRFKNWKKITCREVRFTSHQWKGRPVRIFGFYAHPARREGPLPALLLVHGGGGFATVDRVVEAASLGYAALSIDLPGKGPLREDKSRSTGPDMSVPQIFTVKPDLTDNYIYNAVLAQMRSITFLSTRPETDPGRIGLVGVSWGGATGLITTSLDKRIRCFVDMYGSGHLRAGSTWHEYFETLPAAEFNKWEEHFDASRYVGDISVPVLGLTGTNDNCYYLNRFMRTMREIRPAPQLLLRPNLDHKIDDIAREGYYKWLAVQLKDAHREAAPWLKTFRVEATANGLRAYLRAGGGVRVARAQVYCGEVGDVGWTNRKWEVIDCAPDAGKIWWSADIPELSQVTYVIASAHFADGSVLSTPVNSVGRAVINGKPRAMSVPLMRPEAMMAEAHVLARFTDARVAPRQDKTGVIFVRGDREVDCAAERLEDLYFVRVRDVCQGLGGIVHFEDGQTIISLSRLTGG